MNGAKSIHETWYTYAALCRPWRPRGKPGAYARCPQGAAYELFETRACYQGIALSGYALNSLSALPNGKANQYRPAPMPEVMVATVQLRRTFEEQGNKLVQDDILEERRAICLAARDAARVMRPELYRLGRAGVMVALLREIERDMMSSNEVSTHAAAGAATSDPADASPRAAPDQIGTAVSLIATIAGQTNILALNGATEAARGGEAGRSSAVVAAEAKELTGHSPRAIMEIGSRIETIQAATGQSVDAMPQIARTIHTVDEISGSIAATAASQTAAIGNIMRNAGEVARGTQVVSANVACVLNSLCGTGSAAVQALGPTTRHAVQSLNFKRWVDEFLDEIRAA